MKMTRTLYYCFMLIQTAGAFIPIHSPIIRNDQVRPSRGVRGQYNRPLREQNDNYAKDDVRSRRVESIYDTAGTVDLGKEVFFENLVEASEALSEQLFAANSTDVSTTRITNSRKNHSDLFDEALVNLESLDSAKDCDVSDAVSAILAVTSEAAAAAEASLSEDVANKFRLLQGKSNDTQTNLVPDSYTAASTEMLPGASAVSRSKVEVSAPSVSKILKFAIPAMGVWLCGPLLSLIDTSTVGLLSGTAEQAALNPAVAVTDYGALLIAFLYTGATNMIAAARESDSELEGSPQATKAFIGALQFSTFVGAGLGFILFAFARPMLRAMIGNDAISPAVFDAAMKYVRIRALGMPFAAIIGSAQAACLGMQDIRSPLYVLFVAAIVNLTGDLIFVGNTHSLIGGAAGAAWATVFSQIAGVALFIHWLCHKPQVRTQKPKVLNLSKAILELTGQSSFENENRLARVRSVLHGFRFVKNDESLSGMRKIRRSIVAKARLVFPKREKVLNKTEDNISVRGFLDGKFRGRDLFKFPTKETIDEFSPYILPVTSTQVGRVSGYVAMSHVVASSLGTLSMAAQQVVLSLFYCLCPIADSLNLTAQSFVPSIFGKKPSKHRAKALRHTARNFLFAGGVFGLVMASAVSFIPILSHFFTNDPSVVSLVNTVSPFLMAVFAVHGLVCAGEGLLLGRKDLSYLGKMYASYFVVVPYFMLRVKRAALSGVQNIGLTSVWKVFLSYQMFRCAAWLVRVAILQRRTEAEARNLYD